MASTIHAGVKTSPWSVVVGGECARPGRIALEDLVKGLAPQERIYRLRCVEGWSMVIPWLGVPLGDGELGYTNSVVGLKPGQAEPYRYDKHHLVPFGEFVPPLFKWFVRLMNIPLGDFARGALVQAGAVVVRDVPPHSIVAGNPAQIVGYTVGGNDAAPTALKQAPATPGVVSSSVRGVTLHRLPKVLDLRGNLTVGEFGRSVPFEARRYFMVFGVPNAEDRGEHAHRTCHQFLICARSGWSGRGEVLPGTARAKPNLMAGGTGMLPTLCRLGNALTHPNPPRHAPAH